MHVNFRMKFSCTRNLQRTYKLTKNLPELCLSFRARSYCSPPNLHSFSWLNAHQEHRGHVLKNRDDRGQCEAFYTLLNDAIYEKALISPKSILLILVTSIYLLRCPWDSWAFHPMTDPHLVMQFFHECCRINFFGFLPFQQSFPTFEGFDFQ